MRFSMQLVKYEYRVVGCSYDHLNVVQLCKLIAPVAIRFLQDDPVYT